MLSLVIKNPQGIAAMRICSFDKNEIFTSILVAAEMRYGVEKKASSILAERVELLLQAITILPFSIDADRYYGQIRNNLERQGKTIGANDMLIAAHALSLDATLVTDNTREFERVQGLKIANWIGNKP